MILGCCFLHRSAAATLGLHSGNPAGAGKVVRKHPFDAGGCKEDPRGRACTHPMLEETQGNPQYDASGGLFLDALASLEPVMSDAHFFCEILDQ